MAKTKIILPKEHGSWAMFLLPTLLGIFLSNPRGLHVVFLIGWFFLYLMSTPLLNVVRNKRKKKKMLPWMLWYGIPSLLCLIPLVIIMPSLLLFGSFMLPLFAVNVYFIKTKNERSLWNDLSGIIIFAIGGMASYYIGIEQFTMDLLILLFIITAYFMGSAFYVKSLIRELKNRSFQYKSNIYHALLLLLPILLNWKSLAIAFLPGVLKDWLTPRDGQVKPIHSGIVEIVNSILFFILVLIM